MTEKQAVLREVDGVPEEMLAELHEFIRFLKQKADHERGALTLLSEPALAGDWLRPEEEEAWADL